MSSQNNFESYRKLIKSLPENCPCIPYIGLTVSDLAFIDDFYMTFTSDVSFNFHKTERMYSELRKLSSFQMREFEQLSSNLGLQEKLMSWLYSTPSGNQTSSFIKSTGQQQQQQHPSLSMLLEENSDADDSPLRLFSPLAAPVPQSDSGGRFSMLFSLLEDHLMGVDLFSKEQQPVALGSRTMRIRDFKVVLNGAQLRTYQPNDVIFEEDRTSDQISHLLYIQTGIVRLEKNGTILRILSVGDIIGDYLLLDSMARVSPLVLFSLSLIHILLTLSPYSCVFVCYDQLNYVAACLVCC